MLILSISNFMNLFKHFCCGFDTFFHFVHDLMVFLVISDVLPFVLKVKGHELTGVVNSLSV